MAKRAKRAKRTKKRTYAKTKPVGPASDGGFNTCLVVVGYVSGQDPFRLLGRVSADTGEEALPDPPLTMAEMQSVAFAAKMAIGKVLAARRSR